MVDAAEVEGGSTMTAGVAGEVATTGTATTHSTRGQITITLVVIRVIMAHLEVDRTQMNAEAPGPRPTEVDIEVVVMVTRISHRRTHLPDLLTLPLRQLMVGTVGMVVVEALLLRHLRMEVMAVVRHPPEGAHHPKIITLMTEMIAMLVTELAEGMGVVDMADVGAERPDTTTTGVGMAVRVVIEVVMAVPLVDTITLDTEGEEVEGAVVEVVTTNLCLRYL